MEEEDNKTVTMPLSEYNRMVEEIHNTRMKMFQDVRKKVKTYVGISIEDLEASYRKYNISLKERLDKGGIDINSLYSFEMLISSNEQKRRLIGNLYQEISDLKKKNKELNENLKLLRKEYDIYYNRCVELKEEINKLNQKKNRWQFWK